MKREFLAQNPRPDGYHLMLELYGCDQEQINSRSYLHNLVKAAVKKAGREELAAVEGIGPELAEQIWQFFHQ